MRSRLFQFILRQTLPFHNSTSYWIRRYGKNLNSGTGSYGPHSEFKAEVINTFVEQQNISDIIEYGCGDGHQLSLANYKKYLGFDISPQALNICRNRFSSDTSKQFLLMSEYNRQTANLTLSLDVIYHLVEDHVFNSYMERLFDSSTGFVIIYSTNINKKSLFLSKHVRHRLFSDWISTRRPDWILDSHIPNRYEKNHFLKKTFSADFYIYRKKQARDR